MFRAVCRSSSGAPTVPAASSLHTHAVSARSLSGNWLSGDRPSSNYGRSPLSQFPLRLRALTTCVCKLEAAGTVGAPDDERHTARNMLSF